MADIEDDGAIAEEMRASLAIWINSTIAEGADIGDVVWALVHSAGGLCEAGEIPLRPVRAVLKQGVESMRLFQGQNGTMQ